MNNGRDCFLFFCIRFKLILRDKITIVLFGLVAFLFLYIGSSLFQSAEEKSRIPIGVVNLDGSKMSNNLVDRVKQNAALHVKEGTKEKMYKEMKDQRVEGIFIINKDYEKRVLSGDMIELVSYLYFKENTLSPFLIDVLAGEMMFDICLSKGMNFYYNLEDGILAEDKVFSNMEYINYIDKLYMEPEFNYTFQMETIGEKLPVNSTLYIQIAFGILGMLLSFIILFITTSTMIDKEKGILSRLKTTTLGNISRSTGDFLAVMAVNLILCFGLSFIVLITLKLDNLKILGSIYLILILYSMEYSLLFCVLGQFFRNMISYMIAGSILVIICGFTGFVPIMNGMFPIELLKIFEFFPNSWFIKWITDIMA